MKKEILKKYSVCLVMLVYLLSNFLQSFSFLQFGKVYANELQITEMQTSDLNENDLTIVETNSEKKLDINIGDNSIGDSSVFNNTGYEINPTSSNSTNNSTSGNNMNTSNISNIKGDEQSNLSSTIQKPNSYGQIAKKENALEHSNLVAIFVDDKIYEQLKNEIKRYATEYIQGAKAKIISGDIEREELSNTNFDIIGNKKTVNLQNNSSSLQVNQNQLSVTKDTTQQSKTTTKSNDVSDFDKNMTTSRYNAISNSKAIVLPIDIDNTSAHEITKILENMYFDGVSGETSKLVGVILIGDIPFPVVNQNGFIYPTIYPYVDFEEQKFIWNNDIKYFVYNNNPKGQPEIWHGLISFDTIAEYKNHFKKLQNYVKNPSDFIGKNIWYDDMIANKQYFSTDSLPAYINNFVFAEDIGYKRYSDLMMKIMQGIHSENVINILEGGNFTGQNELLAVVDEMNTPTMFIEKMIKEGYLGSYTSLIGTKQMNKAMQNVETSNRWIDAVASNNFNNIKSSGENNSIETNVHTILDSHYTKIEQKDESILRLEGGLDPLLISINKALEQIVDKKVEQEKYWLNEIIPLTYLKYEGYKKGTTCTRKTYDVYENYFFGTNAKNIQNMQQVSTYRGTFRNYSGISGLTINGIQNSTVPSLDIETINLNKKSIGGSYDIFATQVDANRGYNIKNAMNELNVYNREKVAKRKHRYLKCPKDGDICWNKRLRASSTKDEESCDPNDPEKQGGCEDPQEFAIRAFGGASPLNLSGASTWISGYNFQNAIFPIFDIAGSKAIASKESEANSFEGVNKYSRLIQQTFVIDKKKYYFNNKNENPPSIFGMGYDRRMGEEIYFTNWMPTGDDLKDPEKISWAYNPPLRSSQVNFFNKYTLANTSFSWEGSIFKVTRKLSEGKCEGEGEIYTYKTLDSRVKNTLSTEREINSTSYKVFEDPNSPSKIFYEKSLSSISGFQSEVNDITDQLVSSGKILSDLTKLKNYVNTIKNKISTISNYNISNLESLNSDQIHSLAEQWKNSFTSKNVVEVTTMGKELEDLLADLYMDIDILDIEKIKQYIESQLTNFKIAQQNVYILKTRKDNLYKQLDDTVSSFSTIATLITSAKNNYNTISRLGNNTLVSNLQNKYNSIKNEYSCENDSDYYKLCNALQILINSLNTYSGIFDSKIDEINNFTLQEIDEDGTILSTISSFKPFQTIPNITIGLQNSPIFGQIRLVIETIKLGNSKLIETIAGMNETTFDRPIDSPKYMTFKGIAGDKVTFIYPNLYKSEVFSGEANILKLKSPEEISEAIKFYLRETAKKYNQYLQEQESKSDSFYRQNKVAYDVLKNGDRLAYPKIDGSYRPYNLFDEDYLIKELEKMLKDNVFFSQKMGGYEPIDFIAHVIYYQNLGWNQRKVGDTIQEDIDDIIGNYNVGDKIKHIMEEYLIKDNNKGPYLTPEYRDNGYEVAFINSDGHDYITSRANVPYIEEIQTASNNFEATPIPTLPSLDMEEELLNECNIPEAEGVLLFDISGGGFSSPRINALKCWREKTKAKPFTFEVTRDNALGPIFDPNIHGSGFWDYVGNFSSNFFGYNEIASQYIRQSKYLNPDETNKNVLNSQNDTNNQRLNQVLSYTTIKSEKSSINADDARGTIHIDSRISLGNINFYIKNIGNSVVKISEGALEDPNSRNKGLINKINITEGTPGFSTGTFVFDPFTKKDISFEIENPVAGTELLVFYMCLSSSTNMDNCVQKTVKLDVVPGKINKIEIEAQSDRVLIGSKLPIAVIGTDKFGNNVGELIYDKFKISTSLGTLSQQNTVSKEISFSDFGKSYFILNIDKDIPEGSSININVKGKVDGGNELSSSKIIKALKGEIKAYSIDNVATGRSINTNLKLNNFVVNLPETNIYSTLDEYNLSQINEGLLPRIRIQLEDSEKQLVKVTNYINVASKNGLLIPGKIEERNVVKTVNNTSINVLQKRFSQKNNFSIESGVLIVYFMPNFKAGEDTISLSIPGLETINIKVNVNSASAKMIEINTESDSMNPNSTMNANLKIYDTRGNVVTQDTPIVLGFAGEVFVSDKTMSNKNFENIIVDPITSSITAIDPNSLSISTNTGNNKTFKTNSASTNSGIVNGSLDFAISSKNKGGDGFIYATIATSTGSRASQNKPGFKNISVQGKMLPEKDLNIMYLNLFGDDRGNQRGFMSKNEKYIQKLINNSDKLLSATTQLISPDKVKNFPVIVSNKINFINTEEKEISFSLVNNSSILRFRVNGIGVIDVYPNKTIGLAEFSASIENVEETIDSWSKQKYKNENMLIYIPEQTDSIIEVNKVVGNSIVINGNPMFTIGSSQRYQSNDLEIKYSEKEIADYQIREVTVANNKVGELLFMINKESDIKILAESLDIKYDSTSIRIDGSTNKKGIGFYEIKSSLPTNHLGYTSIQDSTDPTLGIGFTANFKNITNFAAGQSVGESTIGYASEFLINIGDPLIKRTSNNHNVKIIDEESETEIESGFDKGIGETIYSEPSKTILTTKDIDFNNDGLNDLVVAFSDGTIRLLKNYGGDNPFKQVGDLMVLADGIKDIIIGDVDGNGYKDIIVWSKSDMLRVYKNTYGVFDVDGLPICINTNMKDGEISDKPDIVSGIGQIFFEDMNNDGILDIVTNDNLGYIKIFYGGSSTYGNNYVSDNKYGCDDTRYERQNKNNNTNVVYRFGIRVNENTKVLDNSLIRWKGIDDDIENTSISNSNKIVDKSAIEELDGIIKNSKNDLADLLKDKIGSATKFDINEASKEYIFSNRYRMSDLKFTPGYENYNNVDDPEIKYVEIGSLIGSDPVKVYKQYEDINGGVLEAGDKVKVSVTIKALKSFTGTFIDQIIGPWYIPIKDEGSLEYFWFEPGVLTSRKTEDELNFYRDMKNSRYAIDNIHIKQGDEIKMHYRVFYDGESNINKIELKDVDWNKYKEFGNTSIKQRNHPLDGIKDIKILLEDECNKSMFILFNENIGNKKTYTQEYVDIAKLFNEITADGQNVLENENNKLISDLLPSKEGELPDFNSVPGLETPIVESYKSLDLRSNNFSLKEISDGIGDVLNSFGDELSRDNIFNDGGLDLSNVLNNINDLADGVINSLAGNVIKRMDTFIQGSCNGFDLGSLISGGAKKNCGVPVPFNQAFLAPGDYHLFGCYKDFPMNLVTQYLGKGLPLFAVPTNGPITYWPIWPISWQGAGGLLPGGDSSLFRIYVVPTLTAEIGIAMCVGPYSVGKKIQEPLASMGGNCIVFSFPLPCKKPSTNENKPITSNNVPDIIVDTGEIGTCNSNNQPYNLGTGESVSSFELVSSSNNTKNLTLAIPSRSSAGGYVRVEGYPNIVEGFVDFNAGGGIAIGGVELVGGADSKNKIQGGEQKGFVKKLVNDFLNKQVNYILNNLSNFKLDIKWPDFEGIIKGIPELIDDMGNKCNKDDLECRKKLKQECEIKNMVRDETKKTCKLSAEQKCENKGKEWDKTNKTCNKKISNSKNEGSLGEMENWINTNMLSREQIRNWSNYGFANPLEKVDSMFDEIDLLNIRTENINVKVPIITSDDILNYINMSKSWIKKQEEIMMQWLKFFSYILEVCGGEEVNSFKDLKNSWIKVKEQMTKQRGKVLESIDKQIESIQSQFDGTLDDDEKQKLMQELESLNERKNSANADIQSQMLKIGKIKDLNKDYDLSALGNYDIFEGCEKGEYFIRPETISDDENILPQDIYISYKPGKSPELSMFTQGFDLIIKKGKNKAQVSTKAKGSKTSNQGLCIKDAVMSVPNQCVDLFLGGGLDFLLEEFVNIQSSSSLLISSIKQNMETLELYKKFPLELYEWIHVGERYAGEASSLVNNFLGTISMRAKTNANRYSQYIDSIILIKTVLETYQIIIDISANRSEKCGTCSRDNYDQISCKLSILCPNNIPIIPIPPFKIPSIIFDLSKINLGIDIKIPKLNFVPVAMPLPKLPNLPEPPKFNLSIDSDKTISMLLDLIKDKISNEYLGGAFISIPAMPIIPVPPNLPELPSFIPTVKLELPLLPPAPKIPKIPNTLNTVLKTSEIAARVLCFVKKKFGLVGEDAIKARIEQMTQRTYEVAYWDNLDQIIEDMNNKDKIPERLKDTFNFLKANEFTEANLKGLDIGIESNIDLQFDFNYIYEFINVGTQKVNQYTDIAMSYVQSGINWIDDKSIEAETRMMNCVSNPISEECLKEYYTDDIRNKKEKIENAIVELRELGSEIKVGFSEIKEIILESEKYKNDIDNLKDEKTEIEEQIAKNEERIEDLNKDLELTTVKTLIEKIETNIFSETLLLESNIKKLNDIIKEIDKQELEFDEFYKKHSIKLQAYESAQSQYENLQKKHDEWKQEIDEIVSGILGSGFDSWINTGFNAVGSGLNLWNENVNDWNEDISKALEEAQQKTEINKIQRQKNIEDLYKEISNVSYTDYDQESYDASIRSLKETLNTAITMTDNKSISKKATESLTNLNHNYKIDVADEKIKDLEKKYIAITTDIYKQNQKNVELLKSDYNKFLYAIKDNEQTLVNNEDLNVSLSSSLFNTNKQNVEFLKDQGTTYNLYLNNYIENNLNNENMIIESKTHTTDINTLVYNDEKNQTLQLSENILNPDPVKNNLLLSQNNVNNSNTNNNIGTAGGIVDLSNYINVIQTPEGNVELSNKEYVKNFQGKYFSTDINGDKGEDLILWDEHNIYVKYKNGNRRYSNTTYNQRYYEYHIKSYKDLEQDSEDGYVKINNTYIKLYDKHREVKNFKYNGGDFDSIRINWSNSDILGDNVDGYLVKLIHRVDLFNDKEIIVTNNNKNFFDKKYVLVLPKGSDTSGMKLSEEDGVFVIDKDPNKLIWDIQYYNTSQEKIDLILGDVPRNWQYSKIYTLKIEQHFNDNTYYISSPSSNQIVGGPQIIGDTRGPIGHTYVHRPSTEEIMEGGDNFDVYVGTKYEIISNWENNGFIKKIWVSDDEGNILKEINDINNNTGSIELNNLYFSEIGIKNYYFVAINSLGVTNSNEVTLNIKNPKLTITDINTYGETALPNGDLVPADLTIEGVTVPATITAELSHDIDDGYVQFLRNRNGYREVITGALGGLEIDKYKIQALQTIITGGYYDFGNDLGLYASDGGLAVKIKPDTGKISIENKYIDRIKLQLDFTKRVPMIKVLDKDKQIFAIVFSSKELLQINTQLEIRDLNGAIFGDFDGGKAIMYNNEVLLYVGPRGNIYVENNLYGDYEFNESNKSVIYNFKKDMFGEKLGSIEIRIKNLFE